MHPILQKTLGGLTPQYYFRQLFFGAIIGVLGFFVMNLDGNLDGFGLTIIVISTLLYPYSRFVYESIVNFIMGDNVFFVNAFLLLITKFFTMFLCWVFAILIAPIGLAYLYFHHSRES